MSLDTYEGLRAEIERHLDRDDVDIDTFIRLAESRHRREVRTRTMLVREPLTVRQRYIALPKRLLEPRHLRLLTTPVVTVLSQLSPQEITLVRRETPGRPRYFAIHAEIELDRDPDQGYRGEILYWRAPLPLSSKNPTNEVLEEAPELYLYAALLAAEPYLVNDERMATWVGLYRDARNEVNRLAQDQQHAGPLVARVSGGTP